MRRPAMSTEATLPVSNFIELAQSLQFTERFGVLGVLETDLCLRRMACEPLSFLTPAGGLEQKILDDLIGCRFVIHGLPLDHQQRRLL